MNRLKKWYNINCSAAIFILWMVFTLKKLFYFVRIELTSPWMFIIIVMSYINRISIFWVISCGMFPNIPKWRIHIIAIILILTKFIYLVLKLLYFWQVIMLTNRLPLKLLTSQLKILYYLLKSLSLFLLSWQLLVDLLNLLQHLV